MAEMSQGDEIRNDGDRFVDFLMRNEFRALGKQVKLNEHHIADALDEDIARIIAGGLNYLLGHDIETMDYVLALEAKAFDPDAAIGKLL